MKISSFASLTVSLVFLFPTASFAQFVGRGPTLLKPDLVNPDSDANRYQIDSSVQCPTTTLNASGFAGNGQDWGTSAPDSAAFSGSDNYGLVVGISMPIGGRLSEFCDQYATLRREFEQKRVESILLRNATEIFQTCVLLYNDGVDFTHEVFKKEGDLALLASCHDLEPVISKMPELESKRNPRPPGVPQGTVPRVPQVRQEVIEPFEKPATNINIINGSSRR
jgi:hypothetical protein